ncbi:MAG: hypothetical protein V8S54_07225 [Lachnospiraceae bacterium]
MDEPTHSNATENKEDDCQMAERKMSMKNRMKQLSALVLAATMAMGTYTSAFAADMTVYLRSIGKDKPQTQELSFTVHNVNSNMSICNALRQAPQTAGMLDPGVTLDTAWNQVTNSDNTEDWYLTYLAASDSRINDRYEAGNNGGNTILYKKDGETVGGYYEGNSWMWCLTDGNLNSTAYPTITLSDQKCKDSNFAIILSYDYSAFPWGDTTGTPEKQ